MTERTLGRERVRVSFNPKADDNVDTAKKLAAALIDLCELFKKNGEQARCAALAQTAAEDAAMWAVKAITADV